MQDELLEYGSAKASVMEISHRGADFMALAQKSEQDLRDLMNIPDILDDISATNGIPASGV
jgi:phosphoserine aminotransferase